MSYEQGKLVSDDQPGTQVIKTIWASDGVQLEYEVLGTGEPLVMLHGVFAGRGAFSRQRELADQYPH